MARNLLIVLWLLALAIVGSPVEAKPQKEKADPEVTAEEKKIIDLTNAARAKEKLPPMKINATLVKAARDHSANMAKQGKMEHVLDGKKPGDRVAAAGYDFATTGENIASGDAPTVEEIFQLWMNSPGHRANILGKYEEIGVGLAKNGRGQVYFTQVFGTERRKR